MHLYGIRQIYDTMNLKIGDLSCRIETKNLHWKKFLEDKYRFFVVNHQVKPTFTILIIPQKRVNFKISFLKDPGAAIIYTPLNLRRFRTFNFFLKTVLANFFLTHDGFFLHASSIVKNGRGFVFTGKQGVGKSTVIKLAKTHQALSDDFAIIRKTSTEFSVFSSPFYETNPIRPTKIKSPIQGVYFLVQAEKNRLVKLKENESLSKIVSLILTPLNLPSVSVRNSKIILESVWKITEEFVRKTPCFMLYFKKDKSFLKLLKCN